jgi:hypothetical protein
LTVSVDNAKRIFVSYFVNMLSSKDTNDLIN